MDINALLEMGFDKKKVENALKSVGGDNVEAALNLLLLFPDTLGDDHEDIVGLEEDEAKSGGSQASDTPKDIATNESMNVPDAAPSAEVLDAAPSAEVLDENPLPVETVAKSIKCEDCGKILRQEEVEFHAVKTGHENYSESTEDIKAISKEEMQEALKKAKSLIERRRVIQEEKKRREEIEQERNRRKVGQELSIGRQKLEDQERIQAVVAKRKEKREAQMHRMRVLQDIERDKKERQEKFSMPTTSQEKHEEPVTVKPRSPKRQIDYDTCHLQIRLTNGESLVKTFSAGEELAAVRLYVQLNRTDDRGPFTLRTNFPRRLFTEKDMSTPLCSLDLCPKSVLIVSKSLADPMELS